METIKQSDYETLDQDRTLKNVLHIIENRILQIQIALETALDLKLPSIIHFHEKLETLMMSIEDGC